MRHISESIVPVYLGSAVDLHTLEISPLTGETGLRCLGTCCILLWNGVELEAGARCYFSVLTVSC